MEIATGCFSYFYIPVYGQKNTFDYSLVESFSCFYLRSFIQMAGMTWQVMKVPYNNCECESLWITHEWYSHHQVNMVLFFGWWSHNSDNLGQTKKVILHKM